MCENALMSFQGLKITLISLGIRSFYSNSRFRKSGAFHSGKKKIPPQKIRDMFLLFFGVRVRSTSDVSIKASKVMVSCSFL